MFPRGGGSGGGISPPAGDIGGSTSTPTVVGFEGRALTATAPTNGQVYEWNGSNWAPATPGGGGISPPAGDIGGTTGTPLVVGLDGLPIAFTAPTVGDFLIYDGSDFTNFPMFPVQSIAGNSAILSGYIALITGGTAMSTPAPGSADSVYFGVRNTTVTPVVLTPVSGLIEGTATFTVGAGDGYFFFCNGSNTYMIAAT